MEINDIPKEEWDEAFHEKIQDRDESVWADDPTGERQEEFCN